MRLSLLMPIIWCIIFVFVLSVLKAALISVLEKEDVLMSRASVWLVGQVTAVKSVGNAANCMYHSQSEDWKTCHCKHWPILRNFRNAPRLYENRCFTLPKLWSANPKGVVLFHNIVLGYTKRNVKSVVNSFFLLPRKLHRLLNRPWEMH